MPPFTRSTATGATQFALTLGAAALLGGCAAAATPRSSTPASTAAPIAVATPVATPSPTPTPTDTATPVPSSPPPSGPLPMPRGPLDAGTYFAYPSRGHSVRWQVTVPAGWFNPHEWFLYPTSLGGPAGPEGIAVAFLRNPAVFKDDCDYDRGTIETGTVAELVAAIRKKDGWQVSKPQDVTIGEFSGRRLDVELPGNSSRCGEGTVALAFGIPGTGDGFYQQGPAQQLRVWILDVDGQLIGLFRESFDTSPVDVVAEAEAIVESSVITP